MSITIERGWRMNHSVPFDTIEPTGNHPEFDQYRNHGFHNALLFFSFFTIRQHGLVLIDRLIWNQERLCIYVGDARL